MSETITQPVTFTQINCGECGGTYAINERYREQKWQQGGGWHCPYCSVAWGYFNDNELARTKKALEQQKSNTEWYRQQAEARGKALNTERHRVIGYKGVIAKTKKRLAHGVCPCCQRTFQDLARHMQSKHPDYGDTPA